MNVLVIDVGGTHVKVRASGRRNTLTINSGPEMTARAMVRAVKAETAGWTFDVVSIGYPGVVGGGRPLHEPKNLGGGWVGFAFERAFGKPVRIMNDAAMQALGSYEGGRMLFLGLGTGLGAAMVDDGHVESLEIAHLPYRKGKTYEHYIGLDGLKRQGRKRWEHHVHKIAKRLRKALVCDYTVIGGGNAKHLKTLPGHARLGGNDKAFVGGFRMWKGGSPARA